MDRNTLDRSKDALWTSMMELVTLGNPELEEENKRQLVAGFIELALQCAGGDSSARDDYLSTVVPALKKGGMPLGTVISGMVQVSMGGALVLAGENRLWWVQFVSDYSLRLGDAWAAA